MSVNKLWTMVNHYCGRTEKEILCWVNQISEYDSTNPKLIPVCEMGLHFIKIYFLEFVCRNNFLLFLCCEL